MLTGRIDEWGEELRQKGRKEGQLEGESAAAHRLLSRLLRLRFGLLPLWAEECLEQATQTQLETWVDAVLTAQSLAGVIGEP